MAVSAILSRADTAGGVREMRIEGLAAVTFRREGLLLRVNPLAVRVLRTDHDCAGGAQDSHAVFLHRSIDPEHEHVVAHDLWIVGGEDPIGVPFELILSDSLVRLHWKVAPEAARGPGAMTNLAIHR